MFLSQNTLKILSIFFGIFTCLLLLASAELILKFLETDGTEVLRIHPKNNFYSRFDFDVNRANEGRFHFIQKVKDTDEIVLNATYTIDQFNRRITPLKYNSPNENYIMFLGGSYTFGEGVEDDETLPFYLGRMIDNYSIYNYGLPGSGPFDMLAKIQHIDFKQEIKEKQGLAIYTMFDDHVHRIIGSMTVMSWQTSGAYYKKNTQGQLVRKGTFHSGRPMITFIYKFLSKSLLLQKLGITFPLRMRDKHFKLTAEVLHQMKNELQKTYPGIKFIVLLYPNTEYSKFLISHFEQYGIDYLDYTELFKNRTEKLILHELNIHPNHNAYKIIADQLKKDLGLNRIRPTQLQIISYSL